MSESLEKARRDLSICSMCNHPEHIHQMSVLTRLEAAVREDARSAAFEAALGVIDRRAEELGDSAPARVRQEVADLHARIFTLYKVVP